MNVKSVERCPSAKSGGIFRTADSLTLAGSPVFALMALLTMYYDSARELLCEAAGGAPWNGMVTMYLLMCAAHLPPWLKHLGRLRGNNGRTRPQIKAGP
jgi:hypothetical protein